MGLVLLWNGNGLHSHVSQNKRIRNYSCIGRRRFTCPLPPSRLRAHAVTTAQLSQQQAATSLGYTQVSWDNASGNEAQPASASKKWADLTAQEKSAATVLGYTASTWSTISATKKTPWSDLTVTIGEDVRLVPYCLFEHHLPRCVVARQLDVQAYRSHSHEYAHSCML